MMWMGISYNGVTKAGFVEPRAKINSNYYQEKSLKRFLKEDALKLYPNSDFVFLKDSARSNTLKSTTVKVLFY